ncbi:unnamed protein product, partial [Staurois parvus]
MGTDEEALVGGTDGHRQASLMGTERQHSYMVLIGGPDSWHFSLFTWTQCTADRYAACSQSCACAVRMGGR